MMFVAVMAAVGLLIFSYLWVNKAIILMMAPAYPLVEKLVPVVEYANNNREPLTWVWLGLILVLFLCQLTAVTKKKVEAGKSSWLWLSLVCLVLSLAYPLFSNDVYNYLFAAKTITVYGENPYLVKPQVYLKRDLWVDFMTNVDNEYSYLGLVDWRYAYGPVALLYSLIPVAIIGAKRFLWVLWGYKLLNWLLFVACGWMLIKLTRNKNQVIAYWFLSPLLITELLVNSHNDLVMIFFFLLALYWWQKQKVVSFVWLTASFLTKFVSGGLGWMLVVGDRWRGKLSKIVGFGLLVYLILNQKHAWYYSWIYMLLPLAKLKSRSWAFVFGIELTVLIFNYSGFLWLNRWTAIPFLPVNSGIYIQLMLVLMAIGSEMGIFDRNSKVKILVKA